MQLLQMIIRLNFSVFTKKPNIFIQMFFKLLFYAAKMFEKKYYFASQTNVGVSKNNFGWSLTRGIFNRFYFREKPILVVTLFF